MIQGNSSTEPISKNNGHDSGGRARVGERLGIIRPTSVHRSMYYICNIYVLKPEIVSYSSHICSRIDVQKYSLY